MSNANKALARRYFIEIMNLANMKTIDEIIAKDFIFTLPTHPEPFRGPEGFKGLVGMLHKAFPDLYFNVQDMMAQNDTVVTRWRGGGTHLGDGLLTTKGSLPASGRSFEIDGMTWHRMGDGQIKESLGNEDTVGFLTQLGILPPMGPQPSPTSLDHNQGLAAQYFNELLNKGKLELIPTLFQPTVAFHIPTLPDPVVGHEGMTYFVKGLRTGFPDIHFTVERQAAEGDRVACRWRITGTHGGTFLGFPASGNKIQDQGVDVFRVSGGKIGEIWVNENDMGLLQQMGAIPK